MEPALGKAFLNFGHVDGIHDNDDVGLVFFEEGGIHILFSNAWNIVALHVRVDVAHMLDDTDIVKLRKEPDRFGSPTPHDHLPALLLEAGQALAPLAELGIDLSHEQSGLFLQLRNGFLQRMDLAGRCINGFGLDEEILLVIFEEEVEHLEVVPTEKPS